MPGHLSKLPTIPKRRVMCAANHRSHALMSFLHLSCLASRWISGRGGRNGAETQEWSRRRRPRDEGVQGTEVPGFSEQLGRAARPVSSRSCVLLPLRRARLELQARVKKEQTTSSLVLLLGPGNAPGIGAAKGLGGQHSTNLLCALTQGVTS